MDAISYTVARANLAKTMDQVCNDHVPRMYGIERPEEETDFHSGNSFRKTFGS